MHFAPRIVPQIALSLQNYPAIADQESPITFGARLAEEVYAKGSARRSVGIEGFDGRHCRLALVGSEIAGCACDLLLQEGEVGKQVVGDAIGSIACINKSAVAEQSSETSG